MEERPYSPLTTSTSDLVFLEVTHPSIPRGKAAQRVIRSHVTRLQHRKRRESGREGQSKATSLQPSVKEIATGSETQKILAEQQSSESLSEPASTSSSDDTVSLGSGLAFLNSNNPSQTKTSDTQRLVRSHVTKWQHRKRRLHAVEVSDDPSPISGSSIETQEAWALPSLPHSPSEKLIAKGAAAIRNVILQDSSNTVAGCLNRLGFDLRRIMV